MFVSLVVLSITVALTADFQLPEELTVQEMKTVTIPTGDSFSFCWIERPCETCVKAYNIQIRKYLAEGGQVYQGPLIHRDDWFQVNKNKPSEDPKFCVNDSLDMVGHWIYEARICGPNAINPSEPICEIFSSADINSGVLPIPGGEGPAAWWLYGYLKAPGDIEL